MKIIDRETNKEIKNPDLTKGTISQPMFREIPGIEKNPEDITKEDMEEVVYYIKYTKEYLNEKIKMENTVSMDDLVSVAENLGQAISDVSFEMEDCFMAITELAQIVSDMKGEQQNG